MAKKKQEITNEELNSIYEGDDKAPGEERGIKEKVTITDLKGKIVDGDPEKESDQPVEQTPDDKENA